MHDVGRACSVLVGRSGAFGALLGVVYLDIVLFVAARFGATAHLAEQGIPKMK